MFPLISAKQLSKINLNHNMVMLDATYAANSLELFQQNHLPGAQYVDWEKDLSVHNPNPANGGRHPLVSVKKFNSFLQKSGISSNSHIIVYDQNDSSMAAARLWWMLRAAGLKNVQVLDGGLSAAIKEGMDGFTDKQVIKPGNYAFESWQLPLVEMSDVQKAVENEDKIIIDVRAPVRFHGLNEPIDQIAGHIPTAINIPFVENLNENKTFKSPEELKKMYSKLQEKDIIVHCGSGITACHTLLAFAVAGLEIPALYNGSWSEWSRNNNKMITADN
ncbi:MAG: sulfurtransferase [Flavobacteriaceae bacterium]|nr:sulfurtransferase [Flavobacteriaceae bacterium]